MQLYPAIDLRQGACVRLYQGSYDHMILYDDDPLKVAQSFKEQGASWLHVVDLDGALQGESKNLQIIERIVKETALNIQTGGGIRTPQQIENLLTKGVARVILGSMAVTQIDLTKQIISNFGVDHIVLALDVKTKDLAEPIVACEAWQTLSELSLWQLLQSYSDAHIRHVIVTDIDRDGTLTGPNVELYRACIARFNMVQFQASGGVHSLRCLQTLVTNHLSGAIVGKALYENKFKLNEAIHVSNLC